MNTGDAEHWVRNQLREIYDARENSAIATWVLEKVTGQPRLERLARRHEPLRDEQLHELTTIVPRLQMHEPVQYVLGEAYFQGLQLYVNKHVLIPRPETEELVAWVIKDVKATSKDADKKGPAKADKTRSLKIMDIGTGSGCIALALKKELPKAEVWGCDKSDDALTVARRNGATLGIRVDFQSIDFLDTAQWNSLPKVDILVSNPPYITEREKYSMAPNVVEYEPRAALFVPDEKPLLFYEAIAQFGNVKLHAGGSVYVEIHEAQGQAVVELFQKAMYQNVELRKDMQGKNRMVKASIGS